MRHTLARQLHASTSSASHVGSMPIVIPQSVKVTLPIHSIPPNMSPTLPEARRTISIKGPLGSHDLPISPPIVLVSDTDKISLTVHDQEAKSQRALWGLTRSLLQNAINGVSTGYTSELRLVGVGYRATVEPIPRDLRELKRRLTELSRTPSTALPVERLNMKLGYAHPVYVDIPPTITVTTPAPTRILLRGIDKQKLGLFAAEIRRWRKPEPYRGKGIFIGDETIKLKEIKKK